MWQYRRLTYHSVLDRIDQENRKKTFHYREYNHRVKGTFEITSVSGRWNLDLCMIKCFLICSKISSDADFFVECSARQPQRRVPGFLLTLMPLHTPSAWVWLNTVKTHCDTWDSANAMWCHFQDWLERLSLLSYPLTHSCILSLSSPPAPREALLWAAPSCHAVSYPIKSHIGKDLIPLVSSQQGHRPANSQERDLGNGSSLALLLEKTLLIESAKLSPWL